MSFQYDYILKNGTVIDFLTGSTLKKDIYVRGGKIVAKDESAEDTAIDIIDCSDKYVLPGLIDQHFHFFYGGNNCSTNADLVCPPAGITTAVDAGTAGFANFDLFHAVTRLRSVTNCKAYINVAAFGTLDVPGKLAEDVDPEAICEDEIIRKFEQYQDMIVGIKVRMDETTCHGYGVGPVRAAVGLADKIKALGYHCAVSVHAANLPDDADIEEIAELLRPGDVFCHVFSPKKPSIFDKNGQVLKKIRKAQERGVLMDCCNGRIHWSFENYHRAIGEGFLPDIVSSDLIRQSTYVKPGFSLLNPINALFQAGMKIEDVFKAVTYTPARTLGILDEAGTLDVGKTADIAVFDVIEHEHVMYDRYGSVEHCHHMVLPLLTMRRGEIVFRQFFFNC